MYSSYKGLWEDGLGFYLPFAGAGGLGALGAEPGCDEPVPTAERDALRAELQKWTRDFFGQAGRGIHWHEGHPDLRAYLEDIIPRMDGLVHRPKLLRCSAEARRRAGAWIQNMENFRGTVKRVVPGKGDMTVIPAGGVNLPLHRGRTYHVRGPWYDGKFQPVGGGAEIPKPPAPGPVRTPEPENGGRAPGEAVPGLPPTVEGIWESFTTGYVFGIPKAYLVYGAVALVAYNFLKK